MNVEFNKKKIYINYKCENNIFLINELFLSERFEIRHLKSSTKQQKHICMVYSSLI